MTKLLLIISCFSSISVIGQNQSKKAEVCSLVLKELSYFWKSDSLANNGFRYNTYKRILDSKLDTISVDSLIMYLGNPNKITHSTTTKFYTFYFLDFNKMPKEKRGNNVYYIVFDKKNDEKYFSKVNMWSSD